MAINQLAIKVSSKKLTKLRLDAIYALKPTITWQHFGDVFISCGVNWLTISHEDQLLARLRGEDDLKRFARLLEAGFTSRDLTVYRGLFNNEQSDIHFGKVDTTAELVVNNGDALTLSTDQSKELLLWLSLLFEQPTVASQRVIDNLSAGFDRADDWSPRLIISRDSEAVIGAALEPKQADEFIQALLRAAIEHNPLQSHKIELSDRYIEVAAGSWDNWATITINSSRNDCMLNCSKLDLIFLAADLHQLTHGMTPRKATPCQF